jgi:hypothetical protein
MANPKGNPRWKKGESGNPSGRPKILGEVKELARNFMYNGGFERLFELAKNAANDSVKLKAVELIMGYGFGKPSQKLEIESTPLINVNMAVIPTEQLKQIRQILQNARANPDTNP